MSWVMTCSPETARLDCELVRLTQAEMQLDRELALGLAMLWDQELFWPLGSARATDFVREYLGIHENRARWLARLGRHLRTVPELDQALMEGRIGASQAIELGRILSSAPPVERQRWIERAAQMSVRALKREIKTEIERREAEGIASEPEVEDPDELPPGGWISIPAPARVAVLWHGAVDLARIASGRHLSQPQAAEMIFAEYLSAFGHEGDDPPRTQLPPINESESSVAIDELPALQALIKVEALPDTIEDAWKFGECLVEIAKQKQRLRFDLAGLLLSFAAEPHAIALGYANLEGYCKQRLGFALRRAERLMRFRRGLDRFPKLAAAHLAGDISYTAALLLVPILHPRTEERWVAWARGRTYRAIERVTEQVRPFAPSPGAEPTAFVAEDGMALPVGCALPSKDNGPPRIAGIPEDLALTDPERCVARIRLWMPQDALGVAHRALDRCRQLLGDALLRDWVYLEIILVHFIHTYDTPASRAIARRHRIIARDGYWCLVQGCTSRANLQAHHLRHRAQGGSDDDWNLASDCAGHHVPGVHAGVIEMGGFAPDEIVTRLGVNPRTGRAFASYRNERRISDDEAIAALAEWRRWWRDRLSQPKSIDLEPGDADREQAESHALVSG